MDVNVSISKSRMKTRFPAICLLVMALYQGPQSVYADRADVSWNHLLESSELIVSADLTAMKEEPKTHRCSFHFEIVEIYKGDPIEAVDVVMGILPGRDEMTLTERGRYVLFLKKSAVPGQRFEVAEERFMKRKYLLTADRVEISVVDEHSYRYVYDLPGELFSEKEIEWWQYGKEWTQKAKVIQFATLEEWLRSHFRKGSKELDTPPNPRVHPAGAKNKSAPGG